MFLDYVAIMRNLKKTSLFVCLNNWGQTSSNRTRIETVPRFFLLVLSCSALEIVPIEQGLKLQDILSRGDNVNALEIVPIEQGLKHHGRVHNGCIWLPL